MTRDQLEQNLRLALLSGNITLDHCNKASAAVMQLIDQYVATVRDNREFHCGQCRLGGVCNEELVPISELEQVGPPCCPDCGEVMTPGPYLDPGGESRFRKEAAAQKWQLNRQFDSPTFNGDEMIKRLLQAYDSTEMTIIEFMLAKPVGGHCRVGTDSYYRVH